MTDPKSPANEEAAVNRDKSRDYFRWDERHHQPHTDLSTFQKLWLSRRDAAAYARLVGRSLGVAPALWRQYRTELRRAEPPREVTAERFGVAVSPTRETLGALVDRVDALGVRSLSIRIPFWNPEPVLSLASELERLHVRGYRFLFGLLQNREVGLEPTKWTGFASRVASTLAGCAPTFQIGQAINRKKWGIWHPDEYARLLDATAPARAEAPGARWIGPPVIDFEPYFTIHTLFGRRPFDFDAISSLLYVDRRGSPEGRQYGHFDLRRKILLLRAIGEVAPHPKVPIVLSEFNWPVKGAGKHSPAGRDVQTSEQLQARWMVQYFLTAATIDGVEAAYWWQLVAKGYGLLDDFEGWPERPAYRALRTLVAQTRGGTVERVATKDERVRGFLVRRGGGVALTLWTDGDRRELGDVRPDEVLDVEGRSVGGEISIDAEPRWLLFATADPTDLLASLGLGGAGTP